MRIIRGWRGAGRMSSRWAGMVRMRSRACATDALLDRVDVTLSCATADITEDVGTQIGNHLMPGDVVSVDGAIGAGKTTLCRGIVRSWVSSGAPCTAFNTVVPSPTFVIQRSYARGSDEGQQLHHMDLSRLSHTDELTDLGVHTALEQGHVVVAEWPALLRQWMRVDAAPADRTGLRRHVSVQVESEPAHARAPDTVAPERAKTTCLSSRMDAQAPVSDQATRKVRVRVRFEPDALTASPGQATPTPPPDTCPLVAALRRATTVLGPQATLKAPGKQTPARSKQAGQSSQLRFHDMDVRVGRIDEVKAHPDSTKLFIERIDVGEASPRTVVSGLQQHYTAQQLEGARVMVVCNVKPAKLAGTVSQGMLLATASPDGQRVHVLQGPSHCAIGTRVTAEGAPVGEPMPSLSRKRFTKLMAQLHVDADGVIHFEQQRLMCNDDVLPLSPITSVPVQ